MHDKKAGQEYGVNAGLALNVIAPPSADQLRPKPGKTMMARAWQGISVFACRVSKCKVRPAK